MLPLLAMCIAAVTACKPKSELKDITVAGETFRMPSRFHPYDMKGYPDIPGEGKDDLADFQLLTSDLGQNIHNRKDRLFPDRYNDEVHVVMLTYGMNNPEAEQRLPHSLVVDASQAHEYNIDGIEYLGSDNFANYFLSKSDHKYFHCDRSRLF